MITSHFCFAGRSAPCLEISDKWQCNVARLQQFDGWGVGDESWLEMKCKIPMISSSLILSLWEKNESLMEKCLNSLTPADEICAISSISFSEESGLICVLHSPIIYLENEYKQIERNEIK